jgi:hypothetical protein
LSRGVSRASNPSRCDNTASPPQVHTMKALTDVLTIVATHCFYVAIACNQKD